MNTIATTAAPLTRRAARGKPFGLTVDAIRADYRRDHPHVLRALGRAERRDQRPTPRTVEMPIPTASVPVPAVAR